MKLGRHTPYSLLLISVQPDIFKCLLFPFFVAFCDSVYRLSYVSHLPLFRHVLLPFAAFPFTLLPTPLTCHALGSVVSRNSFLMLTGSVYRFHIPIPLLCHGDAPMPALATTVWWVSSFFFFFFKLWVWSTGPTSQCPLFPLPPSYHDDAPSPAAAEWYVLSSFFFQLRIWFTAPTSQSPPLQAMVMHPHQEQYSMSLVFFFFFFYLRFFFFLFLSFGFGLQALPPSPSPSMAW